MPFENVAEKGTHGAMNFALPTAVKLLAVTVEPVWLNSAASFIVLPFESVATMVQLPEGSIGVLVFCGKE